MKGSFRVTTTPRISRRSYVLAALGSAFALAGAGCLGSSPDPRFYALPSLAEAPLAGPHADLGIGVGPIHLPRYLQRPQIVTRSGDSRVDYDELNRWAGSLESETLRVLGENLGILLGTDRVVVYPLAAPFPTRYRVRFQVERFDGRPGESLDLRARWIISSTAFGEEALAVEMSDLREKLDSSSMDELVRGHGRALGELARRIADRVIALEQAADEARISPAPAVEAPSPAQETPEDAR
jgi:hypothetical protein